MSSRAARAALLPGSQATWRGVRDTGVPPTGANRFCVAAFALALALACSAPRQLRGALSEPPAPAPEGASPASALALSSIIGDGSHVAWTHETASPRWDTDQPLRLPECLAYERPLTRVAAALAAARARGDAASDMKDVVALLRAFGSPHVWPRVWMLEAEALDDAQLRAEWSRWASGEPRVGQRRCGLARVDAGGRSVVVAVVVDALADLAPLPRVARVGQWLRLEAHLIARASSGQLLLMGPGGAPRSVPSAFDERAFHAAFSLDQPGFWRLQLLLDVGSGPQPALEAWVFVDREPDLELTLRAAPGGVSEPSGHASTAELRASLWSMIDGGRRSQGLGSLRREPRLDDVAQAHAVAMRESGQTAHDVGDGMPIDRLARAGVVARRVGENVARAASLERAHRALWDSPSHRGNLVDPAYDTVGIGVARSDSGDVWVCELFAEFGRGLALSDLPPYFAPATPGEASRSSSGIWSRQPATSYRSGAEGSAN